MDLTEENWNEVQDVQDLLIKQGTVFNSDKISSCFVPFTKMNFNSHKNIQSCVLVGKLWVGIKFIVSLTFFF